MTLESSATRKSSSAELKAILMLIRARNIGPVTYHELIKRFGTPEAALDGIRKRTANSHSGRIKLAAEEEIGRELEATAAAGAFHVMLSDPSYPPQLREIPNPPPVICMRGDPALLSKPVLGIVGARNCSAAGARLAADIARAVADAGWTIISGLARGIDTAAHHAAGTSRTAAVLAGGLDFLYPPQNAELFAKIGTEGCLVSEHPIGFAPQARHFPQRNRLISGCAHGVLVVEATGHSGSLITARHAGEQGREVFAVPGSPLDPRSRGTNYLIRHGAQLTESAADILDCLAPQLPRSTPAIQKERCAGEAPPSALRAAPARAIPDFTPGTGSDGDPKAVLLSLVGQTPVHQDELIRQSGFSAPVVSSTLLELELTGDVLRHPGHLLTRCVKDA